MPEGSPNGAQCTGEGQTRNSRRFSREGGGWGEGRRAVGFFKSKDQMRPFLSCDWNRKSPAVHQKPEQGLKRQKKQRHSTYLKTVGWVCFEDLSTLPDGEITG